MGLTVIGGMGGFLGILLSCTPSDAFWTGQGVCRAEVNTAAAVGNTHMPERVP